MTKNILVTFDMQIGDCEHSDQYIFHNKTTDYNYCKQFWSLKKKNKLEENIFYGFFSPKFYEKTGFDSDFISKALAENVDKDVLLFSPAWDQLCFYVNPWEQGEQHHKGKSH